ADSRDNFVEERTVKDRAFAVEHNRTVVAERLKVAGDTTLRQVTFADVRLDAANVTNGPVRVGSDRRVDVALGVVVVVAADVEVALKRFRHRESGVDVVL